MSPQEEERSKRFQAEAAARQEIKLLRRKVEEEKHRIDDVREWRDEKEALPGRMAATCTNRRRLEGHYDYVQAVAWGNNSEEMMSISRDGKIVRHFLRLSRSVH